MIGELNPAASSRSSRTAARASPRFPGSVCAWNKGYTCEWTQDVLDAASSGCDSPVSLQLIRWMPIVSQARRAISGVNLISFLRNGFSHL